MDILRQADIILPVAYGEVDGIGDLIVLVRILCSWSVDEHYHEMGKDGLCMSMVWLLRQGNCENPENVQVAEAHLRYFSRVSGRWPF